MVHAVDVVLCVADVAVSTIQGGVCQSPHEALRYISHHGPATATHNVHRQPHMSHTMHTGEYIH